MIDQLAIQDFANRVGQTFHPAKIILFGSQARGMATLTSDVDILVVIDHSDRNIRKAIEILRTVQPSFPLDLIVRRPDEIVERMKNNDYFLTEIYATGKVLYESSSR